MSPKHLFEGDKNVLKLGQIDGCITLNLLKLIKFYTFSGQNLSNGTYTSKTLLKITLIFILFLKFSSFFPILGHISSILRAP